MIPSLILSLIIKASNMVRYSWHCGIVVFWSRSKRLLQSTTAYASAVRRRASSGFFQSSDGSHSHIQWRRSQLRRSIAPLSAYVSEAKVLATTLAIFREYHIRGLTSLACHSPICLDAAKIRQPFWDWDFDRVAKEASENDTNLKSSSGILLIAILVVLLCFAS